MSFFCCGTNSGDDKVVEIYKVHPNDDEKSPPPPPPPPPVLRPASVRNDDDDYNVYQTADHLLITDDDDDDEKEKEVKYNNAEYVPEWFTQTATTITTNDDTSTTDESWNERYMKALDMPEISPQDIHKKYERLTQLNDDFHELAINYGRTIITELSYKLQNKTIAPLDVGGVAGGLKSVVNGIFFKLARDPLLNNGTHLYSGNSSCNDEFANKALSNELKGAVYYESELHFYKQEHPDDLEIDIRVPMHVLVDYRGYRLLVRPYLPISKSDTVYGSHDGGRTVYAEEKFTKTMNIIGERLFLQSHMISSDPPVYLTSAGDVEGALGSDGRYYLLDFGRTFPPEYNNVKHLKREKQSIFYRLMRPEFVKYLQTHKLTDPLNPDALTRWSSKDKNFNQHNETIKKATHILLHDVIPSFAKTFEETINQLSINQLFSYNMADVLHEHGINMRHMGLLRSYVAYPSNASTLLLVEMITRTLKNCLRASMRQMAQIEPSYFNFQVATVKFLNMITGSNVNECNAFWNDICVDCARRYGDSALHPPSLNVRDECKFLLFKIIQYILTCVGLQFSELFLQRHKQVQNKSLYLFNFTVADIVEGLPRVKHMSYMNLTRGRFLLMHDNKNEDQRILKMANKNFGDAVKAEPLNLVIKKDSILCQAACLNRMSSLYEADMLILNFVEKLIRSSSSSGNFVHVHSICSDSLDQLFKTWKERRSMDSSIEVFSHANGGAANLKALQYAQKVVELYIHWINGDDISLVVMETNEETDNAVAAAGGGGVHMDRRTAKFLSNATNQDEAVRLIKAMTSGKIDDDDSIEISSKEPTTGIFRVKNKKHATLSMRKQTSNEQPRQRHEFELQMDKAWLYRHATSIAFWSTIRLLMPNVVENGGGPKNRHYENGLPMQYVRGDANVNVNLESTNLVAHTQVAQFAAHEKQPFILAYLLEIGFDLNTRHPYGNKQNTLLCHACAKHDSDFVRVLAKSRADLNVRNADGNTPLMLACLNSINSENQNECVRILIKNGCDISISNKLQSGMNALHIACAHNLYDVVVHMLNAGAEVDVMDDKRRTPLIHTSINGHTKILQHLCAQRAHLVHRDHEGLSALHHACINHSYGCLKILIEAKAPLSSTSSSNQTCLHLASLYNAPEIVKLILSHNNEPSFVNARDTINGSTAYLIACENGYASIVKILCQHCDVNIRRHNNKRSGFELAAINGHANVITILNNEAEAANAENTLRLVCSSTTTLQTNVDVCKELMKYLSVTYAPDIKLLQTLAQYCKDGDVFKLLYDRYMQNNNDGDDDDDVSLLHVAARYGNLDVLTCIISYGDDDDDIDIRDHDGGKTPLYNACFRDGHYECMMLLLRCKANPNIGNDFGVTPLMTTNNLRCVNALLEVMKDDNDINACDKLGDNALMYAVKRNQYEKTLALIEAKANVDACNHAKETPLHCASRLSDDAITGLLIESKADVNACDNVGRTPLHLVNQRSIARRLLQHNANINALNKYKQSPIDIAVSRKLNGLVELMREYSSGNELPQSVATIKPMHFNEASWKALQSAEKRQERLKAEESSGVNQDELDPKVMALKSSLMQDLKLFSNENDGDIIETKVDDDNDDDDDVALHNKLYRHPLHEHPLMLGTEAYHSCDICAEPLGIAVYYRCVNHLCDWDICTKCAAELLVVEGEEADIIRSPTMATTTTTTKKWKLNPIEHMKSSIAFIVNQNHSDDVLEFLLSVKGSVHSKNRFGLYPLYQASYKGNVANVKLLLKHKASCDVVDKEGRTPLFIACTRGHTEVVRVLLDAKANVHKRDFRYKRTPLFEAVTQQHENVIQLLCKQNADINAIDNEENTPYKLGLKTNNQTIIDILDRSSGK